MKENPTWIPTWQTMEIFFMFCRNLREAHLREVGLAQIPIDQVRGKDLR
jgi:hypothetical protein